MIIVHYLPNGDPCCDIWNNMLLSFGIILSFTNLCSLSAVTDDVYEWDRSMPLLEKEQKVALFESQVRSLLMSGEGYVSHMLVQ